MAATERMMEILSLFASPDEANASRLVLELERVVLERPTGLLLKLVGPGGLPSWAALAMFDLLTHRDARTRLATQAYGPLCPSDLLVWLAGELRGMAPGSFAFLPEELEPGTKERELGRELLVIESVLGQALSQTGRITASKIADRLEEFLPARELAGSVLQPTDLRELGLLGDAIEDLLCDTENPPTATLNPQR